MTGTAFNISMVFRADTTGAKGGLADFEAGLRNITTEAGKTNAATAQSTAELERLAAATGKAALAQDDLAAAEKRAQAARGQSLIAPMVNPAAQIAPVTAIWRGAETAAELLRGTVGGLNATVGQQAHEMVEAAQASRQYQLALENVRAQFNPLFAASRQYEQQLERIALAERDGAISAREAAQARMQAAQIITPVGMGVPGGVGVNPMHTANIGAQGFDIGVTAAMGMNPMMIGLQQGTQLVQVMQAMGGGKTALQGIAAGFMGILNPMSLATIGVVAFGAMGIQALMSLGGEAKSFEDAMSDLSDAVTSYEKNLRASRASTADLAREFGSAAEEVRGLLAEMAELDRRRAQRAATDVLDGLKDDRGLWLPDLSWQNDNPNANNNAQLFDQRRARDIADLRGVFDLDRSDESRALVSSVLDALTSAQTAKGEENQIVALNALSDAWTRAAEAKDGYSKDEDDFLGKVQGALRELQKLNGDAGNTAGAQQAEEVFQTYKQQMEVERASLAYGKESVEVRKLRNQHELDGLKTRLESLKIDEQSVEGRRAINTLIAVQRERELAVAAEKQAQRRAQQDQITGLQRELALIGATSAERTRAMAIAEAEARVRDGKLRGIEAELELTNAIAEAEARIALDRGRAAYELDTSRIMDQYDLRAGLARDPGLRADIEGEREYVRQIRAGADAEQAAAEANRVRARAMNDMVLAQDQFLRGQAERIQSQQLELSLIGQTAETRARVLAMVAAEREIIATGAGGEIADKMRSQARIEAEYARTIEAQADAWRRVQSAGEAAIDGVLDKLREGDIAGAFEELASEIEKGFFDLAVANPLKNAIFGSNLGTMADAGGLGGIWDRLRGKNPVDEKALVAQAVQPVQSMMVQAASVTLSGNLSGFGRANQLAANTDMAPGRMMGSLPGSGDVQSQVWQFFAGKGLKPHQIAGIMGNASAESAFNPLAVGDGGTSFGLFQHHAGRGQGLLGAVGGKGGLGDVQAQLQYVWQELMTTEVAAMRRLMSSTDVRGATEAWASYERPAGYSAANPAGSMHFDKRLAAAEVALAKFGTATQTATTDLGTLGGGFDIFGTALSGFAKGGAGGAIEGLLSGLGMAIAGGLGIPGFAAGGFHAGGLRVVGENGPELEATGPARYWTAAETNTILRSRPAPMAANGSASIDTRPVIQIVNNSSAQVAGDVEETTDARGQRQHTLVMSDAVATGLAAPGGRSQRALRNTYGVAPAVRRRGG